MLRELATIADSMSGRGNPALSKCTIRAKTKAAERTVSNLGRFHAASGRKGEPATGYGNRIGVAAQCLSRGRIDPAK
jgi:hypothetical protein